MPEDHAQDRLSQDRLRLLACPDCRGPLRGLPHEVGRDSCLVCDVCSLAFPVHGEIPILLPRAARNPGLELPLLEAAAARSTTHDETQAKEDARALESTLELLEARGDGRSWEWEDEEYWGAAYRRQAEAFQRGETPPVPRWPVRLWQREFLVSGLPDRIWGPGQTFVDVGSGAGHNFRLLLAPRVHPTSLYVACDISLDALKLNRLRNPHPNGLYVLCSADRIPLRSGSIDLLTYFGILHHTERKAATLAEDSRLLRPGGKVLLHEVITRKSARPGFLAPAAHGSAHEESVDRDDLLQTLDATPELERERERWSHTAVFGAVRKVLRRALRSRAAYEATTRLDAQAARWLGGVSEVFQPGEVLMLLSRRG